jgi:hypothetical protein
MLHYAKAITYLHCQLENFIISGSAYCDCEKQVTDNNDINQNNTAQKTVFKEKGTDNIFTLDNRLYGTLQSSEYKLIFLSDNISHFPGGFDSNIFQPPKA